MMNYFEITTNKVTIKDIEKIINNNLKLVLSDEVKERIKRSKEVVYKKLNSDKAIYGINTGFGDLCNISISSDNLSLLQKKLILSHSCGLGQRVRPEIVKIMLLLKIISLSKGASGISPNIVERLIYFFNNDILPEVFEQGSLGASGDLAPLAHLSLPIIGYGNVFYKGKLIPVSKLGLTPLKLNAKDGLALLNGTQFMCAYGVYLCIKFSKLINISILVSSISYDSYLCKYEPLNDFIHKIRRHKGQIEVAKKINKILKGSELSLLEKKQVQDPYSFRCIPQVLGSCVDILNFVNKTIENEINAVTDNPVIDIENDLILSGGNFHGQPLSFALDFLSIAMAETGSISERRIFKLLSGQRGLPPFLIANPGLNSGFMIAQYTAASIVNQNKQLCTPSSVDSIESSIGQEDHVSMGANAATKAYTICENIYKIIAIELMCAFQALDFRRPLKSSIIIEREFLSYRKEIPFVKEDTLLSTLINKSINYIKQLENEYN